MVTQVDKLGRSGGNKRRQNRQILVVTKVHKTGNSGGYKSTG